MSIADRLAELGIELPQPAAPVASYVPVVIAGGLAAGAAAMIDLVDDVLGVIAGHAGIAELRVFIIALYIIDGCIKPVQRDIGERIRADEFADFIDRHAVRQQFVGVSMP